MKLQRLDRGRAGCPAGMAARKRKRRPQPRIHPQHRIVNGSNNRTRDDADFAFVYPLIRPILAASAVHSNLVCDLTAFGGNNDLIFVCEAGIIGRVHVRQHRRRPASPGQHVFDVNAEAAHRWPAASAPGSPRASRRSSRPTMWMRCSSPVDHPRRPCSARRS